MPRTNLGLQRCWGKCVMSNCNSMLRFFTPWTAAHQVPLSVGFSRQEYWSGLPFSTLGDLPNLGIKPMSWVSRIGRRILYHCVTWEAQLLMHMVKNIYQGSQAMNEVETANIRFPPFQASIKLRHRHMTQVLPIRYTHHRLLIE